MARWMVVVLWLVMGCASEDHGLLRYQRFSEGSTRGGREDVASVHGAALHSVDEVKGSLGESRAALAVLEERPSDFGGRGFDGVFGRYLEQGTRQLTWARGELGSAMVWMGEASEVEDSDMELALLRMAGRRLVQAGVISAPAVSAAVRIHGGQVLMAQANEELPEGVREALGDSPEVRGMRVTDRAGAGMAEPPKHHVLPREHRTWFEQRGFKGDMDIDQFCVRLEQSQHEAIHGGGNWKLGRTWPREWNRMIMDELLRTEARYGRTLTRNEILDIVADQMKSYDIPRKVVSGRGR
ncbi:DUF2380 domain-containing protein [Myxococcus sp. AS-1-15]|uniref:DUF2380 domain-containing protein n=1 Tax=Myxococcus sp. AS-1-15 TaxID=2874600 RepID=UPI001CC17D11|nr:DUF2380 domain-containing protein [Myxococcus sp. AS-1-15]